MQKIGNFRRHFRSAFGKDLLDLRNHLCRQSAGFAENPLLDFAGNSRGIGNAPLVVGGLIAWFVANRSKDEVLNKARFDRGTLIASGFIAGGALMGVVSALLKFAEVDWYLSDWAASNAAEWVGLAMYVAIIGYFTWHTLRAKKEE